jgi:hypothetical protein
VNVTEVKEGGEKDGKKSPSLAAIIVGACLIAFGIFFLFPWYHFRLLFPVALIGCGLLLLFFNQKKS